MKIHWHENPLTTVIELDDQDKLLFHERVKVKHLQEVIDQAHFALDPESRLWSKKHVDQDNSDQAAIAAALGHLNIDYNTCGDPNGTGQTLDEYIASRLPNYIEALAQHHCGDCICVPCSCTKCYAEGLLGLDTTRGLGKHEATKVQAAFMHKRTILQAIDYLANYEVGPCPEKWEPERWAAHVPRWTEEARRAHSWLLEYQREHFAV